jgi:hypothetical protein
VHPASLGASRLEYLTEIDRDPVIIKGSGSTTAGHCQEVAPRMSSILHFCEWLAETSVSIGIRESTWSYPIIESVHVLGLCLFVGLALVWDLRLMGIAFRRVPVSEVQSRVMPWTAFGFVLMFISGVLLFWSDPVRFYGKVFFRIKVVALILAGLNAFIFHSKAGARLIEWDTSPITPRSAKVAGGISLVLWAVIIVAGRLIAYNWFDEFFG